MHACTCLGVRWTGGTGLQHANCSRPDTARASPAGDAVPGLPPTAGSGADAVMRSVSSGMLRKGSLLATDPPLSSEAMNSAMPDAAQTTEPGTWPSAAPGSSAEAASPAGGDLVADEEPPAPVAADGMLGEVAVAACMMERCLQVCCLQKEAQTEAAQT